MTIEEIKRTVSMHEVVERYGIKIDRKGFCYCPFHQEKTASMRIYKDSSYCFGCGRSDDIFSFVMGMDSCDFKTAYKALGGSYRQRNDNQHKKYHYKLKKRKEKELRAKQQRELEIREILKEIRLQNIFKNVYTPFSDEWCAAINRLEILHIRMDELTEER